MTRTAPQHPNRIIPKINRFNLTLPQRTHTNLRWFWKRFGVDTFLLVDPLGSSWYLSMLLNIRRAVPALNPHSLRQNIIKNFGAERTLLEFRQLLGAAHVLDQLLPDHQAILSIIVLTVLDDTPFSMYLDTHEQKASWPSAARAVLRSRTLKPDALLVSDSLAFDGEATVQILPLLFELADFAFAEWGGRHGSRWRATVLVYRAVDLEGQHVDVKVEGVLLLNRFHLQHAAVRAVTQEIGDTGGRRRMLLPMVSTM